MEANRIPNAAARHMTQLPFLCKLGRLDYAVLEENWGTPYDGRYHHGRSITLKYTSVDVVAEAGRKDNSVATGS
jgi:hypothetical protein